MDIVVQYCEKCDQSYLPPKYCCPECYNEQLVKKAVSSRGTIYSFTTIFSAAEAFTSQVPYQIILVDLYNGLRVTSRLLSGDPSISMNVKLNKIENGIYWFEEEKSAMY